MASIKEEVDGDLLALQWMEHSQIFCRAIGSLRGKSGYTDATLACEGQFYPVHKFVLSTCSDYFNAIFEWTPCLNPVVVLNNVSCKELEAILDFMYIGEVNVLETQIQGIIHAAECLRIRGLSMVDDDNIGTRLSVKPTDLNGPAKKRKRTAVRKRLPTISQKHLSPPTHPPDNSNPHVPSPHPIKSESELTTEINLPLAVDTPNDISQSHHFQHFSPKSEPQTSPVTNSSLSPVPPHTLQRLDTLPHTQLSLTLNNHQPSPTPQYQSPSDLPSHEHTQEVKMSPSLTPVDKVIQEVKMYIGANRSQILEAHPEDGSVEIPDLLDSLVNLRPSYDGKTAQEETVTLHPVDTSENLYAFPGEFAETSTSSQSDAQYSRVPTNITEVKIDHISSEPIEQYKCHFCKRSYQRKENLDRHIHTHTNEPHKCEQCDYFCETYKALLEHKKEEHAVIHKCHLCGFTSHRPDCMKRHIQTHSTETPHKCPHCGFKAKRIGYLHKHIKNAHPEKVLSTL